MKPIFFSYKWINITWYMVFAISLTIIGYIILKIVGKDNKYRSEIEDYYFLELIAGFIGARLIYVLLNFRLYKGNVIDAFKINYYNLSLVGGVMIALLVLYIGTRIKKQSFIKILNLLLIPFYFSMAVGVWVFEFEGILSNNSQIQTMALSILFIGTLLIHSFICEKNENNSLIILLITMLTYYGISIYF